MENDRYLILLYVATMIDNFNQFGTKHGKLLYFPYNQLKYISKHPLLCPPGPLTFESNQSYMVFLAVMPWSRRWFPAWIVVVILAREFLVTGIRGYVESLGSQFPADWFGKVKMVTQCLAVGVVLGLHAFDISQTAFTFWARTAEALVYATLATSLGSCLSYLVKTRQLLLERSR